MKFVRKLRNVGGSVMVVLPKDVCIDQDLNPEDEVYIKPEEGKHGKYISMWKKEIQD